MSNSKRPPYHGKPLGNDSRSNKPVKILIYDLETAPLLGYSWGKYEQDIIEFEKSWYILCFAYKWLGGKTKVLALPDFKTYKKNPEDDKELVKELWKLFDEADITIAHNNSDFDYKKSNTRFIENGLTPPSPYKVVDTLQVARRHFKFPSNRLDDLGKDLGVGRKIEVGYSVWRDCLRGKPSAWRKMKRYNKNDVDLLYRMYEKLKPWMKETITRNHDACPKCNSKSLVFNGWRQTTGRRYQRLRCNNCGGSCAERTGEKIEKTLMSL